MTNPYLDDDGRPTSAFWKAVRERADLYGADLYGADLYGADLSGTNLSGASGIIGPVMRPQNYLFHLVKQNGPAMVHAGCRWMTIDDYRAHVAAEYPDTDKATDTLAILDLLEGMAERRGWQIR